MLSIFYKKLILKYPLLILLITLGAITLFSTNVSKLEIDASAETLLLEDDKDLAFLRMVESRFKGSEVLLMAYQPKEELLSKNSLQTLSSLTDELKKLPSVTDVDSILTVPLLYSPPQDMSDLLDKTRTLSNSDVNHTMAKNEFLTSPLYKDSLVSKDFSTTSIVIHMKEDKKFNLLLQKKKAFQAKQKVKPLTSEEEETYKTVIEDFKTHRDIQREENTQTINNIRQIMQKYESTGTLFLGGVQMISNDIIGFVKSDLVVYGSILVLLLILVLGIVFRQPRWIFIPLFICILAVIAITSALGYWGWEITVISSNFIALQLIITISMVLHLIVRYQELNLRYPNTSSRNIVLATMLSKSTPTIFAILTTISGFSSLLFSHIHPIINLGWMMSAGIALSLLIAFIVFPTLLVLLKKVPTRNTSDSNISIEKISSALVLKDKWKIFIVTTLIIIFSITGASRLIVENSFINYFKKDTSIYQGMKVIDQELGGTTPLDIVLTFQEDAPVVIEEDEDEEEDSFDVEFDITEDEEQYWFTDEKIAIVHQVHNYLDNLEETGDVQSFATILNTGKILNKNKPLDSVEIAILYKKLPEKYRVSILSPYVNIQNNQIRFTTRIIDSKEGLRRNALLEKIENNLSYMLNPDIVNFRLSNLMVIYNNMLQSLFTTQITTLGVVIAILFVMFLLLFRSLLLTFIALVVNIIPISLIFGFMGWLQIPLDIMTITIAAIAMGIGVDNTIHYIDRFKKEFATNADYAQNIMDTTKSVGHAIFYTSLTIIIGFSILTLSNLIPTIYFGLLTMLVMAAALTSNLILLPKLLLLIKPLTKHDTIKKN